MRGHIAGDLAAPAVAIDNEGYALLKFHGVYQVFDRDSATERKQPVKYKHWPCTVRQPIPARRLTAVQYLALDALADEYANGSLRITTRQSIQFNGVVKTGLQHTIAAVNTAFAAVVKLHHDYGDRGNRRHARLKYVIAEQGEDCARTRLSDYLGKPLAPCRPMPDFAVPDPLGWHAQGDGRLYLGIPVASGRIDDETGSLRSTLREIVGRFGADPILMPSQDIILSEIRPQDRAAIAAILRRHRVHLAEDLLPVERWALACPALPSCGLALTEAERVRGDIVGTIAERLARYGLENERLSIRVTGCPNGCARPYSGDIVIVGRMPGHYALFVSGDFEGTRLNQLFADKVPLAGIAEALDPLFALFAERRQVREGFGDFCHRLGIAALREAAARRQRGVA